MLSSEARHARRCVLALLVGINVLLTAALPLLRGLPLESTGDETTLREDGHLRLLSARVLRTESSLSALFAKVRQEKKILFLGTSESISRGNLCDQINALDPHHPGMVHFARGGASPIHRTIALAKAQRAELPFPPLVLIYNPVYFTRSHDVINEGWLGTTTVAPIFVQMNHRQLREHLNEGVRHAYDEHFAPTRLVYPVRLQRYTANLIYLLAHRGLDRVPDDAPLWTPEFEFDGELPDYDEQRNVHTGYLAIDRFDKSRWEVSELENSINAAAAENSCSILTAQEAPALLIYLPMNLDFYAFHGLDMDVLNDRQARIRDHLRDLCDAPNLFFLDLYEEPVLHHGFLDRMHQDAYGNYQLVRSIIDDPVYQAYVRRVASFYAATRSAT